MFTASLGQHLNLLPGIQSFAIGKKVNNLVNLTEFSLFLDPIPVLSPYSQVDS